MARTAEGATLTAQHRDGQLRIRARALRDFVRLWPLWDGDDRSFGSLVDASLPLINGYHGLSSSFAADYYQAFRRAERAGGDATPRLAVLDAEKVVAGLVVTGRIQTRKAILAGQSPQAAMQTALIRTSGNVTRHVLDGGRGTVIQSTGEDRRARGWERVTAGNPCAFCEMLASRGAVFSADTGDFQAHDHCACGAAPAY